MQYPLISEYVRAIQNAGDNLGELAHLVPVLDNHGEPYRSSGAFAVVFKMNDEQTGKAYALKCFTEEQDGRAEAYRQIADELECVDSSYLTSVKYLEKELFVDSDCEEEEFPVLLMDWVDGETMDTYIAANYRDEYAMTMLCYRFCKMAAWLRSQPFAHGDIKPDNIMVRPDGSLTLVDYDGMFVPAMKGQKSPTVGTKDFSHPLRTINDFDETIDDFALATIALSLKAISLKPSLLDEYGASDRLLFSADDYLDLSKSKMVAILQELMNDEEVKTLSSLFLLASAKKNLALCSFRLFIVKKPKNKIEDLSTEVTDEDLKNAITDEYGVKYSRDGKRLLRAPLLDGTYRIKANTKVICDMAFYVEKTYGIYVVHNSVKNIVIPCSVIRIGKGAFCKCDSLASIIIPNSVTSVGCWAFARCLSLSSVIIPNSVTSIADNTFFCCRSLSSIVVPNSVTSIGNCAFWGCRSLSSIVIPKSVISIGDSVFGYCNSLSSIAISDNVVNMNGNPFVGWKGKLEVYSSCFVYKKGVLFDKDKNKIIAFRSEAEEYIIPNSVTDIGDNAFCCCHSLSKVTISPNVINIGNGAFSSCSALTSVYVSWTTPLLNGADKFKSVDKQSCTLYVPKDTSDEYYLSEWGDYFDNIVEYDVAGMKKVASSANVTELSRYSVNGQRLDSHTKGLNIVKYSDGSVRKIAVQ